MLSSLGLEQDQQNPGALAQEAFFSGLYGDQPYGIPPDGTEDSLRDIAVKDLRRFHQRYYVASNMVIAMIGAIDRTQAELIALQLDNQLPTGTPAPALPAPEALQQAQRELGGRNVPTIMLYGRVVEHIDISVEEMQQLLQRLIQPLD